MTGARAGHAARKNLAALLNERRQNFGLLVVNEVRLVHAEPANLLLAYEIALSALGRTARPAGTSAASRSRRSHAPRGRPVRLLHWCVFFCHSILLTNLAILIQISCCFPEGHGFRGA